MESGTFDGADDCEHTGLGFVDTFEIFAMQDAFFLGLTWFLTEFSHAGGPH